MTPTKQTVYLPVEVEDESGEPLIFNRLFLLKGEIKDVGDYFGDGVFYSEVETKTTQEVTHWLKPQELLVFTPEELNEYTANVVRQALETAAEKVEHEVYKFDGKQPPISKLSITNTFEETCKKFEV